MKYTTHYEYETNKKLSSTCQSRWIIDNKLCINLSTPFFCVIIGVSLVVYAVCTLYMCVCVCIVLLPYTHKQTLTLDNMMRKIYIFLQECYNNVFPDDKCLITFFFAYTYIVLRYIYFHVCVNVIFFLVVSKMEGGFLLHEEKGLLYLFLVWFNL